MNIATPSSSRILITGAAGGIGRGIALALIAAGQQRGRPVRLALADIKPSAALDKIVQDAQEAGAEAYGITGDVTDARACEQLIQDAVAALGGDLTTLVSNAGASRKAQLGDLDADTWDWTFNLNCRATLFLAKAAREGLARSRGSIVAIASMSGLQPHPGYGAYSAAKAALIMLCRQLAQEWAAEGIRVNTVCPGMTRTPLTEALYHDAEVKRQREALVPLGTIGTPDDIGAAVAYMASEEARYVTGQNLVVDGGILDRILSMMPGRAAA